jgi:hydroxypyruvate reductase
MNLIRKRLSRIKGGRLARYLRGRRCLQLMIADVPGNDPATIGSAPLFPAAESSLPEVLPAWLQALLCSTEPAPVPGDTEFAHIETHVIASNELARQAAREAAEVMGLVVRDHPGHFQGPAETLAAAFVEEICRGEAGLYLWGGESSVKLPPTPGRGGRNQHLALAAARELAGEQHCLLLAAGTDGSDGPTEEAGALVDGATVERGEEEGISLEQALREADSGRFLEASGDLVETGPTGTNVMDLVIGWRWDAD